MKYIHREGQAEITEKKSRFLASVCKVESEEEALKRIAGFRKKYWDASHNCFAYVIGGIQPCQRCSDDKEPSGTAGKPILDVLTGNHLENTLIVVTRYFGGTLLGTGGLVRAYSRAAKEGLENSVIMEKRQGILLVLHTDYNGYGKIQYLLGKEDIPIMDSSFTEEVTVQALIPVDRLDHMKESLLEATDGRAQFTEERKVWYALTNKEAEVLE